MKPTVRQMCLLGVLSLFLFGFGISGYDLWPPDEPRYAQVAREMRDRGDFLTPHVNGQPYYEKPPLLFWAMAACSAPWGDVTEPAARIPSVASGVATVLLTCLLALRLFDRRTAFWAAVILMTGARFWWQARTGQIDMLLTACVTAALYGLWRWEEDRRGGWLILCYAATAAGAYAKGPVALVFPLLFIAVFYWRNRPARRRTNWLLGAGCVLLAVAVWYVPARVFAAETAEQAVASGMGGNLFRNIVGRLFLGVSKAQPPWYYATTLPVDLLPWTLVLPWALPWVWRRRASEKAMWFLWCASVPALIFFSLSVGKRAVYLLPLFPVLAIWLAVSTLDLIDGAHARGRRRIGLAWSVVLLLVAGAPVALRHTEYAALATRQVTYFAVLAGCLGLALLAGSLLTDMKRLHVALAASFAVLATAAVWAVFPVVNTVKSARAICAPVRALADAGADFHLYSVGFSREEYVYYSRHPHEEVFTNLVGNVPADSKALLQAAETQKAARKRIAGAVDGVPVANIAAVTVEERAALRHAIENAIESAEEDIQALRTFEKGLIEEIDAFAALFAAPDPAFVFVQEEDWRWLVPLFTTVPAYHVVQHREVGRREVLLLANDAAMRLAAGTVL